ncbi:MAG TPA: DUF2390 domain-containing protein [Marinobacterium sp.]|nr:DUF2390 domain-containing protein [Marinobacterium sp.]
MLPPDLQLDNPLWDYAIKVYPTLAPALLTLQTQGARVNQLLAALWSSANGRQWPGQVDPSIERWHQSQVLPIRERRMALKPELEAHPQLEPLYKAFKTAELNLERIELAMLYTWLLRSARSKPVSAQINIDLVLRFNQVDQSSPARSELLALVEQLEGTN